MDHTILLVNAKAIPSKKGGKGKGQAYQGKQGSSTYQGGYHKNFSRQGGNMSHASPREQHEEQRT
eukprot:7241125-Ditylum_brightwellii.AAC.1